jgi:S1-C subfamily serine protease
MFDLNWIDLIIIALLAGAVVEGIRIGVLSQVFAIAGFFITLFVVGWIMPHLLPMVHDRTLKTMVNAGLVLTIASYAAVRSLDLAQKVHWSFRLGRLRPDRRLKVAETVLGAAPGLLAGLVLVWLLGVTIGRLPFEGLSNSVNDARVVQQLVRTLPPAPAVFAWFGGQIDPNAQPRVLERPKPHQGFAYSPREVDTAEVFSRGSVVRITSLGCGGLVGGTGFAVAPHLVATNAHVIAGIGRSIVKYNGQSAEATPVLFNAVLDLAIVRVPAAMTLPPLPLAQQNVPLDSTVAVLGYPGGNYRAEPGIVRDTRAVSARTIYDQGAFGRGVYVVQTHLDYGNSGGPIVLANGQVAGMVFSKSLEVPDTGYALTSPHIAKALKQASSSYRRVSTGACMVQ